MWENVTRLLCGQPWSSSNTPHLSPSCCSSLKPRRSLSFPPPLLLVRLNFTSKVSLQPASLPYFLFHHWCSSHGCCCGDCWKVSSLLSSARQPLFFQHTRLPMSFLCLEPIRAFPLLLGWQCDLPTGSHSVRHSASHWELCFRLLDLLPVPWMSQASFVWNVLLSPTTSFFTVS